MLRSTQTRTQAPCDDDMHRRPRRARQQWAHALDPVASFWYLLRWAWAAAFLGALAGVTVTSYRALGLRGLSEPSRWPITRLLLAQPGLITACVTLAILLTLCVYLTYRLQRAARHEDLAPYLLKRVRQLRPEDFVPRYMRSVYLPRREAEAGVDADLAAWAALRHATTRGATLSAESPLGICIYGRRGQGKTRLAWEVLRTELPHWTLIRWQHRPAPELDVTALRSRHIVLWLDDLHEYANPTEAIVLNDLPRQFAEAGIQLVIVATCAEEGGEARARAYLGGLVERLAPIRLADITEDEADEFVRALEKVGVTARRDQFERTPGSIVLGIRGMCEETYPRLSEDARCILQTLTLLRSAGIYSYPIARVRATAVDVFGLTPPAWQRAYVSLIAAGFLTRSTPGLRGEPLLTLAAPVYLDLAVPRYVNANGEISDDWPWLQGSLERRRDAEALLSLGNAFSEMKTGGGPFLPYDPRSSKQFAVTCFRATLELRSRNVAPHDWAVTQANLGLALYRQAEIATGFARIDLQRQCAAAYSAALEIITCDERPAEWAAIQLSLAALYRMRATDAVYAGEMERAMAALQSAWRATLSSLRVYTPATDPAHYRQAVQHRDGIREALGQLV